MDFPDLAARVSEYESLIRRIKEVISARVMLSPDGQVEEIHVLASGVRGAKQLVRDVESCLMAQGVAVDHKKVSIAQLSPEPQEAPASDRLRLAGLTVAVNGHSAEVRVRLETRGAVVEGAAVGPSTASGRLRSSADATLRALAQCVRVPVSLYLEDCTAVRVGVRPAVSAVIAEIGPAGERTLVGSALIRQDETEAAVRATLDAVNRRLVSWQAPGTP